jgi:hypothetical protein
MLGAVPIPYVLAATATAYFVAIVALVVTETPLGSPLFFAVVAIAAAAYAAMVARVWSERVAPRRLVLIALGVAVALRVPLVFGPVGADSDMVRYLWDGRVQRLGYNPYEVIPADPALAHTHTDQTARMPSRRDRTPYPPAAQLFFRLVVTISDSTSAMKLALLLCDLVTMGILWRWLRLIGRSEWLALTYAWNPLVVFEIGHSGHIDALGAMWVAAAAYWLARRRTSLATVAFVLAIGTKLVPIVLAPLFLWRIRVRDALLGVACLAAIYLPFLTTTDSPLGAVPNVIERIRFNSPLFTGLAAVTLPRVAAAAALVLSCSAAVWARRNLDDADPGAWAWPMAVALLCAPVIYPWYLLYLTPFLFTVTTLPLTVWTVSALSTYQVWAQSRHGGRWLVPAWVLAIEFGSFAAAIILVLARSRRQNR